MSVTSHFKVEIQDYLEQLAVADTLFAPIFQKPNKNIDDCVTYIVNEVHKTGCNGFTEKEIYGMAVHYYDEDNLEVGKPIDCRVVVNHHVELTEEEKEQAQKEAMEQARKEAYEKIKRLGKKSTTQSNTSTVQQGSLF